MDLSVTEIKPFVPASDFEAAKQFYLALSFEIPWSGEGLAYVRYEHTSFLLQHYDRPDFIGNYMMHLLVANVDDWHRHVLASGVVERHKLSVEPPRDQPWRMRDFTLSDPSGVLWRIAQNID